jgi:hypothetical protein
VEDPIGNEIQELRDRMAIHDCLMRYCRGVDRLDRELILSAYHPDAIDDHGLFVGNAEEFADWALQFHRTNQHATQHIVTNHSCELDGGVAHTETYWMFAAMNTGSPPLSLVGGRYIDRFERRDGRWAIAARKCMIDWHGTPGPVALSSEALAACNSSGMPARDRSDPSYERPLTISEARSRQQGQRNPA